MGILYYALLKFRVASTPLILAPGAIPLGKGKKRKEEEKSWLLTNLARTPPPHQVGTRNFEIL